VSAIPYEILLPNSYHTPEFPMIKRPILSVVAFALVASACDGTPTAARSSVSPLLDGGWTAGSGNRAAPADSTKAVTVPTIRKTCDGGWTAGSGNVAPC
jgi:hypothetical protein